METYDRRHAGTRVVPQHITIDRFDNVDVPYTKTYEKIRPKNCETCTREMITMLWEDIVWKGILYKLLEYRDTRIWLSEFELGYFILWNKRTIQNGMKILRESSMNQYIEMKKKNHLGRERRCYRIKKKCKYDVSNYHVLVELVRDSHYKTKLGMNKPETYIMTLLNSLFPGQWRFTGDRIPANRIGNIYPDFRHNTKPLAIEFHGPYSHGLDIIDENSLEAHDRKRIRSLADVGLTGLILREEHLSQKKKDKKALNEYLRQFNEGLFVPTK